MTPEEKAKHLEALEDMYDGARDNAMDHASKPQDHEDLEAAEQKWRAAIDAFKALCEPSVLVADFSKLNPAQRALLLAAASQHSGAAFSEQQQRCDGCGTPIDGPFFCGYCEGDK